ncbi:hypothetical protein INR49_028604, partial [Caranx melampygus]
MASGLLIWYPSIEDKEILTLDAGSNSKPLSAHQDGERIPTAVGFMDLSDLHRVIYQISRMILSLSSSLCARSSSSADVNTFMLSVRSNRLCLRAERSEVVSQSESESLESEDESAGRARFLTGGRWRGWQSVRQEIWTTRAKSVRKRPKHTPQTKKSAALSGWSVMEVKMRE